MSRILDCSDPSGRARHVATTVANIKRGRVAVVPDESMYMIVCDAFSHAAVDRIRRMKGRTDAPLSVLVGMHGTVDGIAGQIAPYARDLMQAFWPGPLTLILRQQPSLAWPLRAAGVPVRMPLHPLALEVVRSVGPTATTAANRAGLPPALGVPEAVVQFDEDVDVYLDAGPIDDGARSTVVDATGAHPVILRPGSIPSDRIESVSPAMEIRPS